MRKSMHVLALAAFVVAYSATTLCALAADTEDYSTYLALQSSDQNRNNSSFTRANWGEGKEIAKAGGKYYVPQEMTLWTLPETATFPGDSLAVAGTLAAGSTGGRWNYFRDLTLLPGAVYRHSSDNHLTVTNLIVRGTQEQPSLIDWFVQTNKLIQYSGKLKGDETAVLKFGRGSLAGIDRAGAMCATSYLKMNASGYLGKIVAGIGTYMRLAYENPNAKSTGIYHTYPGTMELMRDSVLDIALYRNTTNVIANLVFNQGAELHIPVEDQKKDYVKYKVTNSLVANDGFRVGFSFNKQTPEGLVYNESNRNGHIPLIHLTGPVAECNVDFSKCAITNLVMTRVGNLPENVRLGLVENGDGSKNVSVVWDPVILMNKNNSSSGSGTLAFSQGDCWSTGTVPDEDFSGTALVDVSAIAINAWQDISRSKMKLTVKSGSTVYHQGKSLTLGELHLVGGSSVFTYSAATTPAFFGKLVVWPGSKAVSFSGWNKKCYMMYSEILGSGEISVKNHNPTSVSMELFGTNVNYSGSFIVDSHVDSWIPESGTDECTTLYLNDGRNLGGPYSGDDGWKALAVKGHSIVEVRDDVTLDEPTRGIYIENAARFKVPEGKTFAINQNITFAGELEKLGAGRLSLGGGARFVDSDSLTETKRLAVSEGVLKVVSTNALDGVETKFAVSTMLELDAFPSSDGMAEWGIVNTKYDTPFAAAGKVKVSFIDDGTEVLDSVSVAICTVKSEAAASLPFVSGRFRSGFYSKTSLRDNGNGTKTLLVEHQRMGTRIIVR